MEHGPETEKRENSLDRAKASAEETLELLLALRERGIMDTRLLNAFEAVPRRLFLNAGHIHGPLTPHRSAPIPCGQVQTAPLTIARILSELDVEARSTVLEVGTGSGYQTALLSKLSSEVFTVERFRTLKNEAVTRFESLKLNNVHAEIEDGEQGWPERHSFDRIIINTAIREPSERLIKQLESDGILIAPIIDNDQVVITKFIKQQKKLNSINLTKVFFTPLISGVAVHL